MYFWLINTLFGGAFGCENHTLRWILLFLQSFKWNFSKNWVGSFFQGEIMSEIRIWSQNRHFQYNFRQTPHFWGFCLGAKIQVALPPPISITKTSMRKSKRDSDWVLIMSQEAIELIFCIISTLWNVCYTVIIPPTRFLSVWP